MGKAQALFAQFRQLYGDQALKHINHALNRELNLYRPVRAGEPERKAPAWGFDQALTYWRGFFASESHIIDALGKHLRNASAGPMITANVDGGVFRFDCTIGCQSITHPPSTVDCIDDRFPEPLGKDEVVRDTWRLISAVQAWPTTALPLPQLVDYGHNNGEVLKQAIPLINDTHPDLTWNHSVDAKDVAGHVENASWEPSSDIPAGVNAELVVDASYDRKAATGLKNGQLRNGSIGVTMDMQRSHPDMPWERFVELQGETVEGRVVRWLPERIIAVRHMALVSAGTGADPNAGRRKRANAAAMNAGRAAIHGVNGPYALDVAASSERIFGK